MDFGSVVESAKSWIRTAKHKTGFELINVNETERKLTFACGAVSFYVIAGDQVGAANDGNSWNVWSDEEKVLPHLQSTLEMLDSKNRKEISDILQKVNGALVHLTGPSAEDVDEDEDEDGEEEEEDYYQDEDLDVAAEEEQCKVSLPSPSEEQEDRRTYPGDPIAVQRLIKDLKAMANSSNFGVRGAPKGDNLFTWEVQLINFDIKSKLGKDLREFATRCSCEPVVYMEMLFPPDYPMAPPFVRVIKPRFKVLTGHVTIGGSICMEMLTKSGWTPTNDIESVLVQIRTEIMSDHAASLDMKNLKRPYEEAEAREAFNRMVARYGWNK